MRPGQGGAGGAGRPIPAHLPGGARPQQARHHLPQQEQEEQEEEDPAGDQRGGGHEPERHG